MSSKSRGGLSKREYAAKKAGGNLNYKTGKISVPSKSSGSSKSSGGNTYNSGKISTPYGSYNPNEDMGYIASDQYQQAVDRNGGKPMPDQEFYYQNDKENKSRDSKSKGSKASNAAQNLFDSVQSQKQNQRQMASNAFNGLSTSGNIGIGGNNPGGGINIGGNITNIKSSDQFSPAGNITGTTPTTLGRFLQIASDPTGMFKGKEKPDLGITEMLGLNNWLRVPSQQTINTLAGIPSASAMTLDQPYVSSGQFETPTQNEADTSVFNPYTNTKQTQKEYSDWVDNSGSKTNDLAAYNYYQNQADALESSLSNVPDTQFVAGDSTSNNNLDNQLAFGSDTLPSVSSGGYSDLGNEQQMLTDYSKQYNTQEKNQKKMLNENLSALDSLINQSQEVGRQALNESKTQDLAKLASLFASYGTSDSEQRMQQEQRTNSDYAGKLQNLLNQLANQKIQTTADYKNAYNNSLNQISNARMQAQMNVEQMMQDAAQRSFDNKLKLASLANSNAGNIRSTLSDLASNWMSSASSPYGKPGGREVISNYMSSLYGGSPSQYSGYLPNGWEEMYYTPSKQTSPTRSTNPMPTDDGNGGYVDGNPYSPTYGMPMEYQ